MIIFNLQGEHYNWNTSEKKDGINYPKTPEEAITMLNQGKTIEIHGKFQLPMCRIFEILGIRNYNQYNENRACYVTYTPI
jgi:hypothetical protein